MKSLKALAIVLVAVFSYTAVSAAPTHHHHRVKHHHHRMHHHYNK
jgi:hypothetical protein